MTGGTSASGDGPSYAVMEFRHWHTYGGGTGGGAASLSKSGPGALFDLASYSKGRLSDSGQRCGKCS